MPMSSLTDKLAKANANMRKLCEFFAARREWDYPPETEQAITGLASATAHLSDELRKLMALCGANPTAARIPEVRSLGTGTHDPDRLQRFVVFVRDLGIWFSAQTSPPTESGGIAALREMDGHVGSLDQLLGEGLRALKEAKQTERQQADPTPAPAPEPAAPPPTEPDEEIEEEEYEGFENQLVLENRENRPLIQVFQGREELTPECERMADKFLAAWQVDLNNYQRKKFLQKIQRWITSAPDGQVLVIKMKTIEEPYEPYPSYVSREFLERKRSPQDD